MKRPSASRTSLLAVVFATGSILASCGGGGGSSPMSEADFCAKATELDNSSGDITPEAVSALSDLAKRAPTKELRDAMGTLLPAWQKLITTDTNDAEAFAALMEEFDTEEINAAGQVMDDYFTNVCGAGGDDGADDGDDDGDTMGDSTDEDSEYNTGIEVDAYNDINWDELTAKIDELSPIYGSAHQSGSGSSALFPGIEISVNFDGEGDGLAFCNALLEWIEPQTEDTNVIIRVQVDNTDVVSRMADSDCMEV